MSIINVALLQMNSCGIDQAANLKKGEAFCRKAKGMGADIALFPEMWNIGYSPFCESDDSAASDLWRAPERWVIPPPTRDPDDAGLRAARERWQTLAVGREDPFVLHFRSLARELGIAVALTYLERWPGAPRNTVSLIDRHGEIALTYAKVHTCDFGLLEAAVTPGDGFHVCDLDTRHGPVRIGAMICYDREFPESARILMLEGAEIILTPNACDLEPNRIGQFRARAYENMVGVAMANYAAPQSNGHSVAFDPIAFDASGSSRDTLVVEAGEEEGVFLAGFDLEALRAWRLKETWGDAFRRPHRYGLLTSPEAEEPFVRVNSRGEEYRRTRR